MVRRRLCLQLTHELGRKQEVFLPGRMQSSDKAEKRRWSIEKLIRQVYLAVSSFRFLKSFVTYFELISFTKACEKELVG